MRLLGSSLAVPLLSRDTTLFDSLSGNRPLGVSDRKVEYIQTLQGGEIDPQFQRYVRSRLRLGICTIRAVNYDAGSFTPS